MLDMEPGPVILKPVPRKAVVDACGIRAVQQQAHAVPLKGAGLRADPGGLLARRADVPVLEGALGEDQRLLGGETTATAAAAARKGQFVKGHPQIARSLDQHAPGEGGLPILRAVEIAGTAHDDGSVIGH